MATIASFFRKLVPFHLQTNKIYNFAAEHIFKESNHPKLMVNGKEKQILRKLRNAVE